MQCTAAERIETKSRHLNDIFEFEVCPRFCYPRHAQDAVLLTAAELRAVVRAMSLELFSVSEHCLTKLTDR